MGKKTVAVLGSENEEQIREKAAVKREQKKLREGKDVKKDEVAVVAEVVPVEEKTEAKKESKRNVHHRSKNYAAAKAMVDVNKSYPLTDGLKLLREVSYSKAGKTVELHLNLKDKISALNVDLPHSTGKAKIVAVANDETLAKIESGKIDFDVLLASPAQMGKLVKFAKVLGPKGLMPNPKLGTVTDNPDKKAAEMAAKNSLQIKTEKDAPLVHLAVAKLDMSDAQISENILAVTTALTGKYTKMILKSSMSPAIKIAI